MSESDEMQKMVSIAAGVSIAIIVFLILLVGIPSWMVVSGDNEISNNDYSSLKFAASVYPEVKKAAKERLADGKITESEYDEIHEIIDEVQARERKKRMQELKNELMGLNEENKDV